MQTTKRQHTSHKIIIIIATAMATVVLGIGAYYGVRAIYNGGVTDGRQLESNDISDQLKALGTAVSEKTNFQQSINEAFADIPKELNTETIDTYIAKLEELVSKAKTEGVVAILQNYLGKWQAFKETYASENNGQIEEAFNGLKSTAEDTAKQIKTEYDAAIEKAVQEL